MSDGRIFAVMERLHGRASTVRQAARDEERDLDELLARTEKARDLRLDTPAEESKREDVHPVPTDLPEPDTPSGGGFVLVRGEDEIEGPKVLEEARNVESEATTREPSSFETEPEFECASCGATCEGKPHIGDGGFLCSDCSREQRRWSRQAATGWKNRRLDTLSELILRTLEEDYPESLAAREIVGRLIDAGLSPKKADKTEINSRLYRDVNEWVRRTEGTPPIWTLRDGTDDATEELEEGSAVEGGDSEGLAREPTASCAECGEEKLKGHYRGSQGRLCERCAVTQEASDPPTFGWDERALSRLSRRILAELETVYPAYVSTTGLADRIQRLGGPASDVDASTVQARLKGPLYEYVISEVDDDEWWSLARAPQKDDDAAEDAVETETTECPICGSNVEEQLSEFRGFNMCSECVNALQ